LFTWLYGLDTDYPFIVTLHGVREGSITADSNILNIGNRFLNRALPTLANHKTIVHTEQNKETLIQRGHDREAISVIPHGTYESFAEYDH